MSKPEIFHVPRRKFLASASCLLLGEALFPLSAVARPENRLGQEVPEKLSSEDLEWVEKSTMAKDMKNYFGKGYSCAESLFMVSLRFLGKPEELVWAAAGFGGGLYHKDLCGFLTAGIMAIGVSAGTLKKERKEAKEYCSRLVKQYWKWWASRAPLRCADIRTERASRSVCVNLGRLAAAKVEELISAG
jgi:hypothetical protein